MNKDYLTDVYQDFFGSMETRNTPSVEVLEEEVSLEEIDSFLLEEESKDLLKKVFDYMRRYSEKVESQYLSFPFLIQSDNSEMIENVISMIQKVSNQYHYTENANSISFSFYDINSIDSVREDFSKNSMISFKDIKGIDLKDNTFQKQFFHLLEENVKSHKIIFLQGEKEELDYFFELGAGLKTYFPFLLIGRNPDVQDVYQEVLDICKDSEIDDDFSVKILDYISETYEKREEDYPTYRDGLCREILFHHRVPTLESEKSLDEIFASLNELVGLDKVKNTLHELVDYMSLRNKNKDLKLNNVNLHMVFLGNPGTGKTTVARIIVEILYHLKYIKQNKLVEVTSKDLVGEYVGQTAPKTMGVVERAMGGVLFIDEAYALASVGNQSSYNAEAIATLIKAMEDYRDDLVVIFAGYTKEMQDFLDSNSGIVSRIGYTLEFDDYTEDELVQIFDGMMRKAGFTVEEDAYLRLREIIRENKDTKNFGNARFVRNVYEKTIVKHAANTKNKKRKKILCTITKEDISCENLK